VYHFAVNEETCIEYNNNFGKQILKSFSVLETALCWKRHKQYQTKTLDPKKLCWVSHYGRQLQTSVNILPISESTEQTSRLILCYIIVYVYVCMYGATCTDLFCMCYSAFAELPGNYLLCSQAVNL